MYAHKASCAASLYPHRHIQRDELNVQYNAFLLMAGCGVLEVGHNIFSYNMKINCIAAHTFCAKWKWHHRQLSYHGCDYFLWCLCLH